MSTSPSCSVGVSISSSCMTSGPPISLILIAFIGMSFPNCVIFLLFWKWIFMLDYPYEIFAGHNLPQGMGSALALFAGRDPGHRTGRAPRVHGSGTLPHAHILRDSLVGTVALRGCCRRHWLLTSPG